jgi:hypothetical protein
VTTYKDGKPSDTITTNSNPYSQEEQHWDEFGKQTGGSLEKGGQKYQFDPKTGTYGDPSGTKPVTPQPPAYSRLATTDSSNSLAPPGADGSFGLASAESKTLFATALKYINQSLASGVATPPQGTQASTSAPITPHIFGSQRSWGEASGEDTRTQNTPGLTAHIFGSQRSWSEASGEQNATVPGIPGSPQDESLLGELFPTGFDFGASVDFIFGADPNFLVETRHRVVHGHTWKTERILVGEEAVDADGIPGGPDIFVPIYKNKHVRIDTKKTVTTRTKKDISVVENGDVGGNLNVHYWCNRYVGIEAFNTILSGPGGTVDILGARAEARLPMICGGERHPFGFAPFVYAGCSGTIGGYEDLFGFDIGGGIQLRTRCGFNMSVEAGANLNGTQNYGIGSVNLLWHKPLD